MCVSVILGLSAVYCRCLSLWLLLVIVKTEMRYSQVSSYPALLRIGSIYIRFQSSFSYPRLICGHRSYLPSHDVVAVFRTLNFWALKRARQQRHGCVQPSRAVTVFPEHARVLQTFLRSGGQPRIQTDIQGIGNVDDCPNSCPNRYLQGLLPSDPLSYVLAAVLAQVYPPVIHRPGDSVSN